MSVGAVSAAKESQNWNSNTVDIPGTVMEQLQNGPETPNQIYSGFHRLQQEVQSLRHFVEQDMLSVRQTLKKLQLEVETLKSVNIAMARMI
jgi:hypothetical protein